MSYLLGLDAPGWNPRYRRNVIVYLWVYGILGGVTGITNNALLSYLDIAAPKVVTGLNTFSAISTLLMSLTILSVHRMGYKKILLLAAPVTIIGLVGTIITKNPLIVVIGYVISQTTIGLYDYMYPIMFSVYVPKKVRTRLFTIVMSDNLIFQTIVTFFGGKLVVWFFSLFQGLTYNQASNWSAHQDAMKAVMLANYANSYKVIIFVAIIMNLVAFFITFAFKEQPADYKTTAAEAQAKGKKKFDWSSYKKLCTKPVIVFTIYIAICQAGALLITPYLPIYLNNYLHIPRGITSTINTIQTAAMFLGYFCSPLMEKKMGTVVAVAGSTIACIPLMLIMGMTLIVVVTVTYFLRSGIANAGMPVQNTLQMFLVNKDLRPAFTSLTTLVIAAVGILDGFFTEFYLLKTEQGYATAYFVAAGLYLIGSLILIIYLKKDYNHLDK